MEYGFWIFIIVAIIFISLMAYFGWRQILEEEKRQIAYTPEQIANIKACFDDREVCMIECLRLHLFQFERAEKPTHPTGMILKKLRIYVCHRGTHLSSSNELKAVEAVIPLFIEMLRAK